MVIPSKSDDSDESDESAEDGRGPGMTRIATFINFVQNHGSWRLVRSNNYGCDQAVCRPERGRRVLDVRGTNRNKLVRDDSTHRVCFPYSPLYSELYSLSLRARYIIPS